MQLDLLLVVLVTDQLGELSRLLIKLGAQREHFSTGLTLALRRLACSLRRTTSREMSLLLLLAHLLRAGSDTDK